jgi:hypothetical protein
MKRPSHTASPRGSLAKRVKYKHESDEESEEEEEEKQHPEVRKHIKVERKEVGGEHPGESVTERDSEFHDEWLNSVPSNMNEKIPVKVEVQVWD